MFVLFSHRPIFTSIYSSVVVAITLNMAVIEAVEVHQKWIYSNQRSKSITKHHIHQCPVELIEHQIIH